MGSLVSQLDFCPESEITDVIRRVGVVRQVQRDRGRPAGVNAQKVLRHSLNLEFNVRCESDIDSDHAGARQIAVQPGDGKFCLLDKINPGFNAHRTWWNDVNVFRNQRALLAPGRYSNSQPKHDRRGADNNWFYSTLHVDAIFAIDLDFRPIVMPGRLGRQRQSDISLRRLYQLKGIEIPGSLFVNSCSVGFSRNELNHVNALVSVVESRDHHVILIQDLCQ